MKKIMFVVVLAFSALILAGCGGAEPGSKEFEVSIVDEFSFDPGIITVSPGDTVTITFQNSGSVEHNLNVAKPDADVHHLIEEIAEGAGEEHIHEEMMTDMHDAEPGHSETITFTAPTEPGEYSFLCTQPGHAEAGLVGTLIVE